MNAKQEIEDLQREIHDLQLPAGAPEAVQRHLRTLKSELNNLKNRKVRPLRSRRSLIAIVEPKPPPQVALTPEEQTVWNTFFRFHRSLLQYSGWVNRGQWLRLADVAADMTGARFGGGEPMPEPEFPREPGIWVWDGTSQRWTLAAGMPFPTQGTTWGWDGTNQRWVLIQAPSPLPQQPGSWVWDGTSQLWVLTNGIPFPTQGRTWGWAGDTQHWMIIGSGTGVTDGSSAAPGQIGELMTAGSPAEIAVNLWVPPQQPIFVNLCSVTLTPGDWDVTGGVEWQAVGATTAPVLQAAVSLSTLAPPAQPDIGRGAYFGLQADWPVVATNLGTVALNLTVATVIYCVTNIFSSSAADTGKYAQTTGYILARRMR